MGQSAEEEEEHSWQRSQHVQRHGGRWYFKVWQSGPSRAALMQSRLGREAADLSWHNGFLPRGAERC